MDGEGYVCGANKEKVKVEADKLCFGKRVNFMKRVQKRD